MVCPACSRALYPVKAGGITVDACSGGCGGLWFDQLELKRVDELREQDGDLLLGIEIDQTFAMDPDRRLHCPKCSDIVMMRSRYGPRCNVIADQCPNCGGHWLDAGELRRIRNANVSDSERKAEVDALLMERFGDQMGAMQLHRDAEARHFHPLFSIVRLLFPSCF